MLDFGPSTQQPGGDIFLARLTNVGSTITDSAGTWVPHSWQELRLAVGSLAYEDNELGRTGDATTDPPTNPAVIPGTASGGALAVGTVVFLRLRGWNEDVNGLVYDILGVAGGGSAGGGVCIPVITAINWTTCAYTVQYVYVIRVSPTPC